LSFEALGFAVHVKGGHAIELPAWRMLVKIPASATEGRFTVLEGHMAPRLGGPPPHIHDAHDEAFYVLDGRMRFRIGEDERDVVAGEMAFASRQLVHGFMNPTDEPAVYLAVISPSGYEDYFEEVAAYLAKHAAMPDRKQMQVLMRKYATRLA